MEDLRPRSLTDQSQTTVCSTGGGRTPRETVRLLLVDDDPLCLNLCKRYLARSDQYAFDVSSASSGEEAIRRVITEHFDCLLIDYYLPDVIGTKVLQRIHDEDHAEVPPSIILTANGGEKAAISAVRAGASDFLPKRALSKGSLARAIGNVVENSRLKKSVAARSRELEQANQKLQVRNDEISRFYHSVSHEVKTPLAAVREFVAIVRDGISGPTTDEQRQMLDYALDGCDQIAGHFNELVEMTRLESNKIALHWALTDLSSVVAQCKAGVATAVAAKMLDFSTVIDPNIPPMWLDRNRMIQVLSNLLGNAIKYTEPEGTVTLAIRVGADKETVELSVSDSGCGIEPEHQPRVFERLFQVDDKGDEFMGAGLGLGLSIAQEIVSLHGGRIEVNSTAGVGSVFTVTLPILLSNPHHRSEDREESTTH